MSTMKPDNLKFKQWVNVTHYLSLPTLLSSGEVYIYCFSASATGTYFRYMGRNRMISASCWWRTSLNATRGNCDSHSPLFEQETRVFRGWLKFYLTPEGQLLDGSFSWRSIFQSSDIYSCYLDRKKQIKVTAPVSAFNNAEGDRDECQEGERGIHAMCNPRGRWRKDEESDGVRHEEDPPRALSQALKYVTAFFLSPVPDGLVNATGDRRLSVSLVGSSFAEHEGLVSVRIPVQFNQLEEVLGKTRDRHECRESMREFVQVSLHEELDSSRPSTH